MIAHFTQSIEREVDRGHNDKLKQIKDAQEVTKSTLDAIFENPNYNRKDLVLKIPSAKDRSSQKQQFLRMRKSRIDIINDLKNDQLLLAKQRFRKVFDFVS